MNEYAPQVKQSDTTESVDLVDLTEDLSGMLPGFEPIEGQIGIPAPGYAVIDNEIEWTDLLASQDPDTKLRRDGLIEQIRALIELDEYAKQSKTSLEEAARQRGDLYRRCLEEAWVELLDGNRKTIEAITYTAGAFHNIKDGLETYFDRIDLVSATASELTSDAGLRFLEKELSERYCRPDNRNSYEMVVIQGWPGSVECLNSLIEITDKYHAFLILDGPAYDTLKNLRAAAGPGGLLEKVKGTTLGHRHTALLAGKGLVRERFEGCHAVESKSLYVPLSGSWAAMWVRNIAHGRPWEIPTGYGHPIPGFSGLQLDLLLKASDQFDFYARHRLIPGILLAKGSQDVVSWGADTLSCEGNGVQVGVGLVENILTRYSVWITNKYGLNCELEEARKVVQEKLTEFVARNTGYGRMFKSGSRADVWIDGAAKKLVIDFELYFREVAEKAEIRLRKAQDANDPGEVTARTIPQEQ